MSHTSFYNTPTTLERSCRIVSSNVKSISARFLTCKFRCLPSHWCWFYTLCIIGGTQIIECDYWFFSSNVAVWWKSPILHLYICTWVNRAQFAKCHSIWGTAEIKVNSSYDAIQSLVTYDHNWDRRSRAIAMTHDPIFSKIFRQHKCLSPIFLAKFVHD